MAAGPSKKKQRQDLPSPAMSRTGSECGSNLSGSDDGCERLFNGFKAYRDRMRFVVAVCLFSGRARFC